MSLSASSQQAAFCFVWGNCTNRSLETQPPLQAVWKGSVESPLLLQFSSEFFSLRCCECQ